MDFTEREQQKKRHLIRVILAEAGMVLAVILIVVVTLMITMGFFINSEGRLEQTGLVQIHSVPTGASVTIDGETIFSRTNLSRSLAAGEHHLKLSRDGYDTWERTITMYSGLLLRLYYPRLFLEHRTPETMLTFDHQLEFYSVSSERNFISTLPPTLQPGNSSTSPATKSRPLRSTSATSSPASSKVSSGATSPN